MPELPEVETIRRDLNKEFAGCTLTGVDYQIPKMLQPAPEIIIKQSVGQEVLAVSRVAKLLLMNLKNGVTLGIHLKLTGQLFIRDPQDKADKYNYVTFHFDNGRELRFSEMRKFGYVKLIRDPGELTTLLKEYGPEPLTPQFTLAVLTNILKGSNRPVKVVIMDQKKIAGIGNIYADEALWYSKIHPETKANKITGQETQALFAGIIKVLKQGVEDRGTSVDTYLDAYGNPGNHAQNLQVYRQDKNPCPRCGTIISKSKVGGRGTHFCAKEQIYHE